MSAGNLSAARDAYDRRAWQDTRRMLRAIDEREGLSPSDLRRLAVSSYLTGHLDDAVSSLERLHRCLLEADDLLGAVRWAGWLALLHGQHGQHAQAGGWLARGRALVERLDEDCPDAGLLLVPPALRALGEGDPASALERFARVTALGERFGDPELLVFGRLGEGQALVESGDLDLGLQRLDHAMVVVTTAPVLPVLAGIAYCAVISVCRAVFDLRRAQEWTDVLRRWCQDQQSLRPFRGQCLVHRSEIQQLRGEWAGAMEVVEEACRHVAAVPGEPAAGMARYQLAELLRLQGHDDDAEAAYAEAAAHGHRPHPGLALLRLAQGRVDDAVSAITRALAEAADASTWRTALLPAHVEIALAAGDVEAAERSATELAGLAADAGSTYLRGAAAHARAAVALHRGDAATAATAGRAALRAWQRLDVPYEAARSRVLLSCAYRALGDDDTAELELTTARRVLAGLGAAPALAAVDRLTPDELGAPGDLTPREVEVVRAVATGATNREVAEQLFISERTVARHLSNIFAKLDVGSRSAVTAWAYQHELA